MQNDLLTQTPVCIQSGRYLFCKTVLGTGDTTLLKATNIYSIYVGVKSLRVV
jgi:hypothetical protein